MLQANREHEVPASSRGCVATAFGCLRGCVERFLFAVPVGAAMTKLYVVEGEASDPYYGTILCYHGTDWEEVTTRMEWARYSDFRGGLTVHVWNQEHVCNSYVVDADKCWVGGCSRPLDEEGQKCLEELSAVLRGMVPR